MLDPEHVIQVLTAALEAAEDVLDAAGLSGDDDDTRERRRALDLGRRYFAETDQEDLFV